MGALVKLVGLIVAFVIAIGIVLVVLDANEKSEVVKGWLDACRFLVAPFDDIFDLRKGREHLQIAINWGIAAVVYLAIAFVIASLLNRLTGGFRRRRSKTA